MDAGNLRSFVTGRTFQSFIIRLKPDLRIF